MRKHPRVLKILGTRGVPACHGGFESFAERFSLYMVEQGWKVVVYCQEESRGEIRVDHWKGVERVTIPVGFASALSTISFDFQSIRHARRTPGYCLSLGYNTAIFTALLLGSGNRRVMNMDGIEWSREKWSAVARVWLWANEWLGAKLNSLLIADHPEIAKHLSRHTTLRKIATIPYGAEQGVPGDPTLLGELGLEGNKYGLVVARPEPENSILEIVEAWSRRNRGIKLVVLGNFRPNCAYHERVRAAASAEVLFPGAIYDKTVLACLRGHARLYVHGHRVGGTNPSLIEAMSFGNPVLAHDNRFNRWVAGDGGEFFRDTDQCSAQLDVLLGDDARLKALSAASARRFDAEFRLDTIHQRYLDALVGTG